MGYADILLTTIQLEEKLWQWEKKYGAHSATFLEQFDNGEWPIANNLEDLSEWKLAYVAYCAIIDWLTHEIEEDNRENDDKHG